MSIITARRQVSARSTAAGTGDRISGRGRRFEVKVRGSGSFALTRALVEWVGEALMTSAAMENPVLSANLARGTVDLRVSVWAESKSAAQEAAAGALARAMAAIGVGDVRVRRSGWRRGPVATASAPARAFSLA
jgi:hypothetical protein